jgi:hypothetical protein
MCSETDAVKVLLESVKEKRNIKMLLGWPGLGSREALMKSGATCNGNSISGWLADVNLQYNIPLELIRSISLA